MLIILHTDAERRNTRDLIICTMSCCKRGFCFCCFLTFSQQFFANANVCMVTTLYLQEPGGPSRVAREIQLTWGLFSSAKNIAKRLFKWKRWCVEHPVVLCKRCNYQPKSIEAAENGILTPLTHPTYLKARCTPFRGNITFNPETVAKRCTQFSD